MLDDARRGTLPGIVWTGARLSDTAAEWLRLARSAKLAKDGRRHDLRLINGPFTRTHKRRCCPAVYVSNHGARPAPEQLAAVHMSGHARYGVQSVASGPFKLQPSIASAALRNTPSAGLGTKIPLSNRSRPEKSNAR